jgi:hypothetical protein
MKLERKYWLTAHVVVGACYGPREERNEQAERAAKERRREALRWKSATA